MRMNIYESQLSLLSPQVLEEMIKSMGGGMVVASLFPSSRIVVKQIIFEYTRILDNMLLLRTLRYGFCKWSVILELLYVYKKYFK